MLISRDRSASHGFDQPIGLVSDCHRRIERFLGGLHTASKTCQGGRLPTPSRNALEQAARYFTVAGPHHAAGEEQGLFPRLRALTGARIEECLPMVDALEADHRQAEAWHRLVRLLVDAWLEAGTLSTKDTDTLLATLESLASLYARHIEIEDQQLFVVAAEALSPNELSRIGREMADRRGVPFTPQGLSSRATQQDTIGIGDAPDDPGAPGAGS